MRAKKYYKETILIGKKRRIGKFRFFLIFLSIFAGIFLCIFFSLKAIFSTQQTESKDYFAVSVKIDVRTFETAETKALEFKARGGAGVVKLADENYYIVLAVYPKKEDANLVQSQLNSQSITAQVDKISLPIFRLINMTENEAENIKKIHKKYLETLHDLYDLSIKLDSNQISQSQALMRINELALLWEQRAELLANEINSETDTKNYQKEHALHPIYRLALYVASQLKYLATENTYKTNLQTLISVIRQVNYMLCIIEN